MKTQHDIIEQAAVWHLAGAHDQMDWDAFTLWLEADPAHARAYDEVSLTSAALDEHAPMLARQESAIVEQAPQARSGWKRWAGGAIAASLVALLAVPMLQAERATIYHAEGESMTVTLEDGSQVILAPYSDLSVESQHIALTGGAYFDILHEPSRSLQVDAGPLSISDIGTKFDVQVNGEDVRIAVSEGTVAVASDRLAGSLGLAAGRQLHFDGAVGRSVTSPVNSEAVGGWRAGRLNYSAAPLRVVAADLGRYAGVTLTVPDGLQDRQFSGTLAIGDSHSAIRDLAQLLDLDVAVVDGGYRLESASD